ncbi:aminotransferase class IV-domain-containing protein [Infundibulicybe gibba]|nr:aminotransferase class IV-domain-containing protein [Infundibulicybe gibba]
MLSSPGSQGSSYELLSTTRYDDFLLSLKWNNDTDGPSPLLLLPYHLRRLVAAAQTHAWPQAEAALTYDGLRSACHSAVATHSNTNATAQPSRAFRIRITVSKSGLIAASATPMPSLTADPTSASFFNPTSDNASLFGPVMTIYLDSKPTPPSKFTITKTTQRTVYDDARLRAEIPHITDPRSKQLDVLLFNPESMVTETSIFNIAFYRSPFWVTPAESTGCLPGVLRRWLLEQGRIHETEDNSMTIDSVQDGDWILLFNGAQGCRLGRISRGLGAGDAHGSGTQDADSQ